MCSTIFARLLHSFTYSLPSSVSTYTWYTYHQNEVKKYHIRTYLSSNDIVFECFKLFLPLFEFSFLICTFLLRRNSNQTCSSWKFNIMTIQFLCRTRYSQLPFVLAKLTMVDGLRGWKCFKLPHFSFQFRLKLFLLKE